MFLCKVSKLASLSLAIAVALLLYAHVRFSSSLDGSLAVQQGTRRDDHSNTPHGVSGLRNSSIINSEYKLHPSPGRSEGLSTEIKDPRALTSITTHLTQSAVMSTVTSESSVGVPPSLSFSAESRDDTHSKTITSEHKSPSPRPTFAVAANFKFPHRSAYKPVSSVLASPWVGQLKHILTAIGPNRTVTITVASEDFTNNLLNWLIAAKLVATPPVENIIIVSFDLSLHNFLTVKKIDSIFVPYGSVLRYTHGITRVWMTRMAVIRLISHWGFDVQQFDTDAIILRNPQAVFDQFPSSDVIGGRAKLPFELGKGPWGFTVSMGAILFRHTPRTGEQYHTYLS